MKLNEIVLRDLFSHAPTRENFRFVFLVENEALEDKILQAGYMAVGISDEPQKEIFLKIIEECQFSWMKDFCFIPSSKFGFLGEVKKQLEWLDYTVLSDGWKIFKDKESRFLLNPEELKEALQDYVAKIAPSLDSTGETLIMIPMSEVEEKMIDWLVLEYIPRGQITVLAGDGGSGKTSAWCEIAASISSGKPCFLVKDIIPAEFAEETPRKVIFFSAEDSIETVIRPRLRKAGARLENILSIDIADERFEKVRFNSPFVESLIAEYRPALVIFDPIQAFIPPEIKMSERNAMRNCLRPLIGYGEKYGCTFLIVVHTNKQSGLWGRKRIADSADIWDIARSVMLAGETKEKNIRYISHEKCNYGMTGKTVLFSNETGWVEFKGYTDKKDKDFVTETNYAVRNAPQREEAKEFILDFLRDGEKKVSELNEMAKAVGYGDKTIERAKSELKKEKKIDIYSLGNARGETRKMWFIKAV